jgi:hypothetical protein
MSHNHNTGKLTLESEYDILSGEAGEAMVHQEKKEKHPAGTLPQQAEETSAAYVAYLWYL